MSAHSIKSEVVKSLLFRISAMSLGFVTAAVLIRELGAATYGIWAALTSLLAWVQLSDFGVGYALKNRIAGAPQPEGQVPLVGGVFQFYALMAIAISALFYLFGDRLTIVADHKTESFVLYVATIMLFPLTIGGAILQGMRKNSLSSLMGLLQAALWFVCVLFIAWSNSGLLVLSVFFILTTLLVGVSQFALGARALAGSVLKTLSGLANFRNVRLAFPLWGVGINFILLQLSSVILFSLGTYLTYSNLSPEDAAKYDVLFKFFQLPLTIFNVAISVYWIEIVRSIAKKNRGELRKQFFQLHLMALTICIVMGVFALFMASPVIEVYSGGEINVLRSDALAFWLLVTIQTFSYAGAVFLNAAEKLRGQIILAVGAAAALIPAVLFLYNVGYGFNSVPLATALLITPGLIYCNWAAHHHVVKNAG